MGIMQLRFYCSCGVKFEQDLLEGPVLEHVRKTWARLHSGPGHAPVKTAPPIEQDLLDLEQLIKAATSRDVL